MANINLLPWREREREERKQQFFITLGVAVAIAGLLLLAADRFMVSRINNQNTRNQYLTQQIASLDSEIAEIRKLQEQKRDLTERMAVVQELDGNRSVIVRLFDELVRTLPDGVYYNSVTSDEATISLEGIAESNSRVSVLMRSLNDSEWFTDETQFRNLTAETGSATDVGRNRFQMRVFITSPDAETEVAP